jgi:hypothetical protein
MVSPLHPIIELNILWEQNGNSQTRRLLEKDGPDLSTTFRRLAGGDFMAPLSAAANALVWTHGMVGPERKGNRWAPSEVEAPHPPNIPCEVNVVSPSKNSLPLSAESLPDPTGHFVWDGTSFLNLSISTIQHWGDKRPQ